MLGKVASRSDRRPTTLLAYVRREHMGDGQNLQVSMVKIAGKAKTKLTAPKPSEA